MERKKRMNVNIKGVKTMYKRNEDWRTSNNKRLNKAYILKECFRKSGLKNLSSFWR